MIVPFGISDLGCRGQCDMPIVFGIKEPRAMIFHKEVVLFQALFKVVIGDLLASSLFQGLEAILTDAGILGLKSLFWVWRPS